MKKEEKNLLGFVKKATLLGVGIAAISKEKIDSLANELIKSGMFDKKEGRKFVKNLIAKSEQSRKQIEKQIMKKTQMLVNSTNIATKSELKKLEQRIKKIEAKKKR